jgi:hypothetical protein
LLAEECERAFKVAERLRLALPRVHAQVEVKSSGTVHRVRLILENSGFLPTTSLAWAEKLTRVPKGFAGLSCRGDLSLQAGTPSCVLDPLDGWGSLRVGACANPLYAELPKRGVRAECEWWVAGKGELAVSWDLGRGGAGSWRGKVGEG